MTNEQQLRLEALKLAVKVELAKFDQKSDSRTPDRLDEDIRKTADEFVSYVETS